MAGREDAGVAIDEAGAISCFFPSIGFFVSPFSLSVPRGPFLRVSTLFSVSFLGFALTVPGPLFVLCCTNF